MYRRLGDTGRQWALPVSLVAAGALLLVVGILVTQILLPEGSHDQWNRVKGFGGVLLSAGVIAVWVVAGRVKRSASSSDGERRAAKAARKGLIVVLITGLIAGVGFLLIMMAIMSSLSNGS